jgi:hypothetical protein
VAIYIQINKLADLGDAVVYQFGPAEGIIGKVAVVKATGEVTPLDLDAAGRSAQQFYLPRVQRVLYRHFQCGEFPDRTHYTA